MTTIRDSSTIVANDSTKSLTKSISIYMTNNKISNTLLLSPNSYILFSRNTWHLEIVFYKQMCTSPNMSIIDYLYDASKT